MHMVRQYQIQHICHLAAHDKLWGWHRLSPPGQNHYHFHQWCWCWWGHVGKTITIKRHPYSIYAMSRLQDRKQSNGYAKITEEDLMARWPGFRDQLENAMLFEMLSHDKQA